MKRTVAWLLAPILLVLSACATASFDTPATRSAARLTGAPVYIYSMLDVRHEEFGDRMVAAVNSQIVDRLREHGVPSEVVAFRDTTVGMSFVLKGSAYVPVEAVVASKRADEERIGARYRLIIMPSDMRIYEATQGYEVNWILIDVSTSRVVWRTTLRGSRTIWYSNNEDADGRAATFVNGVIAQMAASGLFEGAGATS